MRLLGMGTRYPDMGRNKAGVVSEVPQCTCAGKQGRKGIGLPEGQSESGYV